MPHRLSQQRMTFSDLDWPFHASLAISAVADHLDILPYVYLGACRYHRANPTWLTAAILEIAMATLIVVLFGSH